MAIIKMDDFEKATEQESNKQGFFTLKDDKDRAFVRFLYESYSDLKPVAVHTIKVNDKDRYVNCIREYDEPKDKCPLCAQGIKTKVRAYIELIVYTKDASGKIVGTPMLWERGAEWIKHDFQSLCERYNPICNTVFEIERSGKKGSTDTKYLIYPLPQDQSAPYEFERLPDEVLDPVGKMVINASEADLKEYLATGKLPEKKDQNQAQAQTSAPAQPQTAPAQPQTQPSAPASEQAPAQPTAPLRRRGTL